VEWTRETYSVVFAGERLVASGNLEDVALAAKAAADAGEADSLLFFDATSSEPIEVDLRGTPSAVIAAIPPATVEARGPGRPKLGVVAREVTLLPRHWQWLSRQPGGASVALRRLVESALRDQSAKDRGRLASESAYRFMTAMAGNLPGYEEAVRALFAGDAAGFAARTEGWPVDIRMHAGTLAAGAFAAGQSRTDQQQQGETPRA